MKDWEVRILCAIGLGVLVGIMVYLSPDEMALRIGVTAFIGYLLGRMAGATVGRDE